MMNLSERSNIGRKESIKDKKNAISSHKGSDLMHMERELHVNALKLTSHARVE